MAILRFHRLTRWAFYSGPTFDRVTDRAKNKKTKEKKRKTFVMSLLRVACRNTLRVGIGTATVPPAARRQGPSGRSHCLFGTKVGASPPRSPRPAAQ